MNTIERFPWLLPLGKSLVCVVFWYLFCIVELLVCYSLFVGGHVLAAYDGFWWTLAGILLLATPLPHIIEHPRLRKVGVFLYLIPAALLMPRMMDLSPSISMELENAAFVTVVVGIPLNRIVHFWLQYFARGPYRDQDQTPGKFDNFWNL